MGTEDSHTQNGWQSGNETSCICTIDISTYPQINLPILGRLLSYPQGITNCLHAICTHVNCCHRQDKETHIEASKVALTAMLRSWAGVVSNINITLIIAHHRFNLSISVWHDQDNT